jgi:hypothetical protein
MDKPNIEKIKRMFDLMDLMKNNLEIGNEDMAWWNNNLSMFLSFLKTVAISRLIEVHNVEKDEASALIETISLVATQLGASEYNDFMMCQKLAESMGE